MKGKKLIITLSCFVFLLLLALLYARGFFAAEEKRPNVIVILIDTLRADHLSMNGYPRDTSPVIDQFAKENVNFKWALTAGPWTPVSVATLFTGLYPSAHGMVPPNSRNDAATQSVRLAEKWQTLAEVFSDNGYFTGAFSSNPWITKGFGFAQGFGENFWMKDRADAAVLTAKGKEIVKIWQKTAPEKPLFMYLHYLDPHDPYNPPDPYNTLYTGEVEGKSYPEKQVQYINQYDGEIRYADTEIGKLFDFLKAEGIYDDAVIVLLADHGEQFTEHGHQGHGFDLHNEELHVPLIIKLGKRQEQRSDIVTLADIYPTLVSELNLKGAQNTQGISLFDKEKLLTRNNVLSEIKRGPSNQKGITRKDGIKSIFHFKAEEPFRLGIPLPESVQYNYDMNKDYGEMSPLQDPELASEAKKAFFDMYQDVLTLDKGDEDTKIEMDEHTIKELKTLGYM